MEGYYNYVGSISRYELVEMIRYFESLLELENMDLSSFTNRLLVMRLNELNANALERGLVVPGQIGYDVSRGRGRGGHLGSAINGHLNLNGTSYRHARGPSRRGGSNP